MNDTAKYVRYTRMRVADRIVAELIGIARALVADGQLSEAEAVFLAEWMHNAEADAIGWPFDAVNSQVKASALRGMDEASRRELYEMLKDLVGEIRFVEVNRPSAPAKDTGEVKVIRTSATLPYTEPVPRITFAGKVFCFTGKFESLTRADCCTISLDLGASFVDSFKKSIDYLVIGEKSSPDWKQSTYGTKIEKIIEINSKGGNIAIVSELDWLAAVAREQKK